MIKDYFPRNLLGRSLLIVVTPLIILQVVSAYIFYESHWDQVSKQLALGLSGDVAVLLSPRSSSRSSPVPGVPDDESTRTSESTCEKNAPRIRKYLSSSTGPA